jgi:hypothetical protein
MGDCGPDERGGPPVKRARRADRRVVPGRWPAKPAAGIQSRSMGLGLGMGGEIWVLGKRATTE